MQIEVSIGEVVDKHTILSLKMLYMEDRQKLMNVNKERQYLAKKLEENKVFLRGVTDKHRNKKFLQNAPSEVVTKEKEREKELRNTLGTLEKNLKDLE